MIAFVAHTIYLCPPSPLPPGIHFIAPACAGLLTIDPLISAGWLIVMLGAACGLWALAGWLIERIGGEEGEE